MKNGTYTEHWDGHLECKATYKDGQLIYCKFSNDSENWFKGVDKNGKGIRHRLDGHAMGRGNSKSWWIEGERINNVFSQEEFENSEEYKKYMRLEKCLRAFE